MRPVSSIRVTAVQITKQSDRVTAHYCRPYLWFSCTLLGTNISVNIIKDHYQFRYNNPKFNKFYKMFNMSNIFRLVSKSKFKFLDNETGSRNISFYHKFSSNPIELLLHNIWKFSLCKNGEIVLYSKNKSQARIL